MLGLNRASHRSQGLGSFGGHTPKSRDAEMVRDGGFSALVGLVKRLGLRGDKTVLLDVLATKWLRFPSPVDQVNLLSAGAESMFELARRKFAQSACHAAATVVGSTGAGVGAGCKAALIERSG